MISNSTTFSADVKLNLYAQGKRFELGQVGPGFAILRNNEEIESGEVELETVIDGNSTRWTVYLPQPITPVSKRFEFKAV